jgi:hypothetical protein
MDIWEKATIIFFMLLMVPLSWILSFSIYNNQVLNKNLNTASISDSEVFNKKEIVELNNNIKESNQLLNPPEIVNAVYVTSWSASSKKYVDEYLPKLFKNTEINAVVIDIKDYSGFVSYETNSNYAIKYKTFKRIIPDLKELINKLHLQGVYTIARITVFEDPAFAQARPDLAIYDTLKTTDKKNPVLWQDSAGLNWLDPSSLEVWDYNISIAKDAVLNGFDEINFDYIRFPSDGKIEKWVFQFIIIKHKNK